MLEVLRSGRHRRMPWRNGGGVTYEVAASPADRGLTDFDWRISIAEVQAGGPFSAFAGIDRTIILIDGEWMALTVDGRRHRFGLRDPFRFDGDGETLCEGPGARRDSNREPPPRPRHRLGRGGRARRLGRWRRRRRRRDRVRLPDAERP